MSEVAAVLQAKLDRAKDHIKQFQLESDAFLGPAEQRTVPGASKDSEAAKALYARYRDRPIPARLPILTGEAIHQLHSCLDHLVYGLIVREGHEPSRLSQFPIVMDAPVKRQQIESYERQIEGIDRPEVRAFIERHQPYKAGRLRNGHGLAILKELSNRDKHRALLLHVVLPKGHTVLTVEPTTPGGRSIFENSAQGSGPRIARVVDMKNSVAPRICFERWGGTRYDIEVEHGVRLLGDWVVGIIKELLPFLR